MNGMLRAHPAINPVLGRPDHCMGGVREPRHDPRAPAPGPPRRLPRRDRMPDLGPAAGGHQIRGVRRRARRCSWPYASPWRRCSTAFGCCAARGRGPSPMGLAERPGTRRAVLAGIHIRRPGAQIHHRRAHRGVPGTRRPCSPRWACSFCPRRALAGCSGPAWAWVPRHRGRFSRSRRPPGSRPAGRRCPRPAGGTVLGHSVTSCCDAASSGAPPPRRRCSIRWARRPRCCPDSHWLPARPARAIRPRCAIPGVPDPHRGHRQLSGLVLAAAALSDLAAHALVAAHAVVRRVVRRGAARRPHRSAFRRRHAARPGRRAHRQRGTICS